MPVLHPSEVRDMRNEMDSSARAGGLLVLVPNQNILAPLRCKICSLISYVTTHVYGTGNIEFVGECEDIA